VSVRDIVILGSTGSIGTQALELVRANPDRFRVVGLTAGGSNPGLFEQQVAEFAPVFSGLGEQATTEAAAHDCDVVLNGITGAVGLRPTLAALDAGNTLALANKESLIMGGALVTERIFNVNGVGNFLFRGIQQKDGSIVVGTITMLVLVFLLANLIVDVLYGVLDPRISND
jgi:1-deoxy-D-xylulose 5-phosphate reductoisomerase